MCKPDIIFVKWTILQKYKADIQSTYYFVEYHTSAKRQVLYKHLAARKMQRKKKKTSKILSQTLFRPAS